MIVIGVLTWRAGGRIPGSDHTKIFPSVSRNTVGCCTTRSGPVRLMTSSAEVMGGYCRRRRSSTSFFRVVIFGSMFAYSLAFQVTDTAAHQNLVSGNKNLIYIGFGLHVPAFGQRSHNPSSGGTKLEVGWDGTMVLVLHPNRESTAIDENDTALQHKRQCAPVPRFWTTGQLDLHSPRVA